MTRVLLPIRLLGGVRRSVALASLRHRQINYTMDEVRRPDWNFDLHRHRLGVEAPGPPVDGGLWHRACRLVRDYEFTPPELLRASYLRHTPLLGRDLLLEGRFLVLRFLMGVRITELVDRVVDGRQVWGWSYETLAGHLERGRVDYEVVKDLGTGAVDFVVRSYSQLNPRVGAILRLGWALFGRRTQLRFYRRIAERLEALAYSEPIGAERIDVAESGGVVLVPSGVRRRWWDRFALLLHDPASG